MSRNPPADYIGPPIVRKAPWFLYYRQYGINRRTARSMTGRPQNIRGGADMGQLDIQLDDDAMELLSQLGGIDERNRNIVTENAGRHLEDAQAEHDAHRLALIDLAHHLSAYFTDAHFLAGVKSRKDPFVALAESLDETARINGSGGDFLIRFRGRPTGASLPAESDYVILYEDMTVDAVSAAALFSRMGVKMSHLSGRLAKAFRVFSSHGISALHVKVPSLNAPDRAAVLGRMRTCLDVISRFNAARKTESPIHYEADGQPRTILPVPDDGGHPDVNLTLAAALNRMPAGAMAGMVKKVSSWMRLAEEKKGGHPYFSVYDALFGAPRLRDQLIQPPVEVNNVKWLALDKGQEAAPKEVRQEKARMTRLVMDSYGGSPRAGARIIQTVYGDDYATIAAPHLGTRLRYASDFLGRISSEKTGADPNAERAVLKNLKGRFDQVDDAVFENLIVRKNVLHVRDKDRVRAVGPIDGKLGGMIRFYKGRSETRKKLGAFTGRRRIDFTARDFKTIAMDFGITVQAAEDLVNLLKTCFDEDGRFLRKVFERNIPAFAAHERKVFRFLWHYLKETPHRNDRVAFLNAMQLLIAKMNAPKDAIRMLLSDVLKAPSAVQFADRNAFMLMNILVRTYNQEMTVDIERTPEEVLRVRDGLDRDAVRFAAALADRSQDDFLTKVRTIHGALVGALEGGDGEISPRFLFLLEREIYIFLSLIGGRTGLAVLRSALKEYGNPDAAIYRLPRSRELAELSLQQLSVIIRGFGRIGDPSDADVLQNVRASERDFMQLSAETPHSGKVRRIMTYIDLSKEDMAPDADRSSVRRRMAG